MIKVNKDETLIHGEALELLTEFSQIAHTLMRSIPESALDAVYMAGKYAYNDDGHIDEEKIKALAEMIKYYHDQEGEAKE